MIVNIRKYHFENSCIFCNKWDSSLIIVDVRKIGLKSLVISEAHATLGIGITVADFQIVGI